MQKFFFGIGKQASQMISEFAVIQVGRFLGNITDHTTEQDQLHEMTGDGCPGTHWLAKIHCGMANLRHKEAYVSTIWHPRSSYLKKGSSWMNYIYVSKNK